jgi:hypothetical protein
MPSGFPRRPFIKQRFAPAYRGNVLRMTTKKAVRTGKNRIRGGGELAGRSKPAAKTTDRRAGDKDTRASHGQKKRQVPTTAPRTRKSGLEGEPASNQQIVRDERKGQNPSRTGARKKSASGR